jgi:hypothetical protein
MSFWGGPLHRTTWETVPRNRKPEENLRLRVRLREDLGSSKMGSKSRWPVRSAAKQPPHRPGIVRAAGLRAQGMLYPRISQTNFAEGPISRSLRS